MKNKKLSVLLCSVLAIQLLFGCAFAAWNCAIYRNCDNEENLFKIKISNVQLSDYFLELYISQMDDLWYKKTVLTTDENGFAVFSEKEKGEKTDNYFHYNYKTAFDMIESECIVCPEGKTFAECKSILNGLLPEDSEFYMSEATKPVYLTAYVYKGVFLPKELYVDGELVLRFDKDKALA